MKSFGIYISKYLASFAGIVTVLLIINTCAFGLTFYSVVTRDYGSSSPHTMLENTALYSSVNGITDEAASHLTNNNIWAMYLNIDGDKMWEVNAPAGMQDHFSIQDIALFAKGYLADYPVFIRNTDDGMLILGYPQDSYTKITGNYFPTRAIQTLPFFVIGMFSADLVILFVVYYLSKRKIIRHTEPIIASIETLSDGKPVSLAMRGELSGVADSVNKASYILSKQNQARANWISGVSHDIRTPLSMIMGYAEQITHDKDADPTIRKKAGIIKQQSIKIKELVQDLNLVSQLEYEMQPIHKNSVRLASLLRSYAAELLNTGLSDEYSIDIEISPAAETVYYDADDRLISRAVNNLVQNSIRHNPGGCDIVISLNCTAESIYLSVSDNGVGLSAEKLKELQEKPHYMESTDDRLDLRHGLGLILVRQIVNAHNGTMEIESEERKGYKVTLTFPKSE